MVRVRVLNMLLELSSSSNVTPTIVTAVIESIVNEVKLMLGKVYYSSPLSVERAQFSETTVLYKLVLSSLQTKTSTDTASTV